MKHPPNYSRRGPRKAAVHSGFEHVEELPHMGECGASCGGDAVGAVERLRRCADSIPRDGKLLGSAGALHQSKTVLLRPYFALVKVPSPVRARCA
eukprot:CAMPEP_0181406614 /NCGR_PEP_ID=MMETSP1110-20121109/5362_1 /TAXON_ID=174948 /ORGANISM="Symbiodinium sp., Strain CCMP421" /LENGTH=94 /DNA_ID=CAMNT_0023529031 /DNA_START=741 /DNA_END=1022 /DNA_ORIENTATION=+